VPFENYAAAEFRLFEKTKKLNAMSTKTDKLYLFEPEPYLVDVLLLDIKKTECLRWIQSTPKIERPFCLKMLSNTGFDKFSYKNKTLVLIKRKINNLCMSTWTGN